MNEIRLVTRRSDLAMQQAILVATKIEQQLGLTAKIIPISTKGDEILDTALHKIGGKGLFTSALQEYLITNKADLAVHSAKDVPHTLENNYTLAACLPREDSRDVLITKQQLTLDELPQGATIATGSLRRKCQLLQARSDLNVIPMRGNILTRLNTLAKEPIDGIILAAAGLKRLQLEDKISEYLDKELMLPAIGQGVIVIETLQNEQLITMLQQITDPITMQELIVERSLAKLLNASCNAAIAGQATIDVSTETIVIACMIGNSDGTQMITAKVSGAAVAYQALLRTLVLELKDQGAEQLLNYKIG